MIDPNIMRQYARELYRTAKEREAWEKAIARQYRFDWGLPVRGPLMWTIKEPKPPKVRKPPMERDTSRDETIRRMLQDEHKTLERVGQHYGVTRERIRQIAAEAGIAWDRRIDIAGARIAEKLAAYKARITAKREARDAKIAEARALVEGGMSIAKAMAAVGCGRYRQNIAKGWPTRYGRWRPELPAIRAKAIEMYATNPHMTQVQVAAKLNMSLAFVNLTLKDAGIPPHPPFRVPRIPRERKPRIKPYRPPVVRNPPEHKPIDFPIACDGWSDNEIATLVNGWNGGQSAAQISTLIGRSRNAVLGKLFRARSKSVSA